MFYFIIPYQAIINNNASTVHGVIGYTSLYDDVMPQAVKNHIETFYRRSNVIVRGIVVILGKTQNVSEEIYNSRKHTFISIFEYKATRQRVDAKTHNLRTKIL